MPVGTMFIRLRSFSKCVPAPRPCALYRRKETRSSGHTRKRMRNTLSRRRTEAHRASSEERDGVFPHTNLFICFALSSSPLNTHFLSLYVFSTFSSLVVLCTSSRHADCDTVEPIVLILKKGGVSVNRCHSMTQRLGRVVARVLSSLTSFVLRRPLAVQLGLGLSSLSSPIYLCGFWLLPCSSCFSVLLFCFLCFPSLDFSFRSSE